MSLNVALLAILIGFNFTAGEQLVGFAQNCLSTGYQRCFVLGTENILITNEVGQILKFFRHNTAIDTSAVYFDVFSLSASLDVIILSPINQPILLISYDTNSDRFTKLSSRLPHATYLINGSISTAITGISSRSNSLTLLLAVASEDMDVPHDNCENCPSLHRFELAIDMSSETYSMTETGSHDDIVAAIDRRTPLDNVKSAQEIFAFSHNGFNYVVRNEFRPNRTQGNLQWVVYLSRVCAADNTDKLKSRVDLSLWCQLSGESYQVANTEADNHGLFARFAQLNVELQSLLVYFQPSDSSRLQRICKFPLSNIEVEFSEAERQCKEARKSDSHPNVFFFRYPGSFVGVPCGQNIVDKVSF